MYDKSAFPPIDLYATRVTPDGDVLDYEATAIPVSTAADRQSEDAIACVPGGTTAMILWRDARGSAGSEGDIFGATFAPGGAVGPERPIAVGTPRPTLPRLVPNGEGFLAAFRSETGIASRIFVQRLDATGAAIDLEPVEVAGGDLGLTNPAAAGNGAQYLVVATWEEPHEINIYARRMRGPDGVFLDPSQVNIGFSFSRVPRVAAFADRWIATWQRHPTHDNPASSVYANFVEANGVPGTPFVVDTGGKQPVVAVGESEAMFALVDRNGPTVEDVDILARRMLSNGTFLDPAAFYVSIAANAQFDPAIAWTGTEYLTAFSDFREDPQYDSKRGDLYAARVGADGTVIDPTGFAAMSDTIPEMFAAVAATDGELLIAGAVFREAPGWTSYRIGLVGTATRATASRALAATTGARWRRRARTRCRPRRPSRSIWRSPVRCVSPSTTRADGSCGL